MEVVINKCYGGFNLSHKAIMRYAELKGIKLYPVINKGMDFKHFIPYQETKDKPFIIHYLTEPLKDDGTYEGDSYWSQYDFEDGRSDPVLLQVVKELGEEVNGSCAQLEIVEIPDDVDYEIEEYDGKEWIAERHRTWR